MTINFYLDSKIVEGNKKAVYCFIRGIENKKLTIIPTNVKINPEHWNKEKQEVRKSENFFSQMNTHLMKLKSTINETYLEELTNNPKITKSEFEKVLKRKLSGKNEKNSPKEKKEQQIYLLDVFQKYLDSKANIFAKNSLKNYRTLFNHLSRYEANKKVKLKFDDMNFEFFDKLRNYYIEEYKLTNNWIRKLFKMLNTFLNWSYDRKYHQNLAFNKYKLKEENHDVIVLLPEELNSLINLDLSDNRKLEKIRDIFIFQCFTGQRYIDIENLEFNDIKDGIWFLNTQKTKDILKIPIIGHALTVYNKYKDEYANLPTVSNQKANDYIKEICKLAGIDTPYKKTNFVGKERIEVKDPKYNFITTHTARRTFVSVSLYKGIQMDVIMKITGHKDYRSFKKYVKIYDSYTQSEMDRVWGNWEEFKR